LFQEGEEGLKELKIFFLRQSGYAFLVIVACLFVKVWRIEDDEVGFSFELTGQASGLSVE